MQTSNRNMTDKKKKRVSNYLEKSDVKLRRGEEKSKHFLNKSFTLRTLSLLHYWIE